MSYNLLHAPSKQTANPFKQSYVTQCEPRVQYESSPKGLHPSSIRTALMHVGINTGNGKGWINPTVQKQGEAHVGEQLQKGLRSLQTAWFKRRPQNVSTACKMHQKCRTIVIVHHSSESVPPVAPESFPFTYLDELEAVFFAYSVHTPSFKKAPSTSF